MFSDGKDPIDFLGLIAGAGQFQAHALSESDIREIVTASGEMLGAIVDTMPKYDISGDEAANLLIRVMLAQPKIIDGFLSRGLNSEHPEFDPSKLGVIRRALAFGLVVKLTAEALGPSLAETVVQALAPFCSFISAARH